MRRAALFQYGWILQSHTLNLAACLRAAGVEVDLFLKDCPAPLVDLSAISSLGVRVHDFSLPPKLRNAGTHWLGAAWKLGERIDARLGGGGVAQWAVRDALAVAQERPHDLYIGIERLGLAWAGLLAERTRVPFVYYSLELYDEAHPAFARLPEAARIRELEKRFHARARATLVQDQARGNWLLRSNGLASGELILLPVCAAGDAVHSRASVLRERFGVPAHKPILLYLGKFEEARGCASIAALARTHGGRFAFVFHGFGPAALARRLSASGAHVSTDLLPAERMAGLVSSADIGLAFYRQDVANDRLTASSSEKVALYCQAGVPFIAQDTESYRELFAQFRCGEAVTDAAGIPAAAEKILAGYPGYRAEAYRAFEGRYRYGAHEARLVERLSACATGAA